MQIQHLSRSENYRAPYGAVTVGTSIRFRLDINKEDGQVKTVSLCYAYGLQLFHESRIRLDRIKQSQSWEINLRMPMESGLFFYWFEVDMDHHRIFYTADRDSADGRGVVSSSRPKYHPGETHHPSAWQVTLYERDFHVPEWLIGAVIYQIFPDRFRRDRNFSLTRFHDNQFPERIFHPIWHEEVDYIGKPETGYLACDFFGGSLEGIREKLDDLARLGIQAIYLNPVFKARSSHRYDTGDYEQIDPLLGDEKHFRKLCEDAEKRGIRILLDGVFSHTGADSRYFNKLERYSEESGAYQEAKGEGLSPYSSWYSFHRRGDQLLYDSWWGFQDLPSVNEHDLTYQDYIAGRKGIVRRWLKLGASGWRLDVSDELPDSFLRSLRKACKAEKKDAVLMGEIWENASHKISYGNYRDFLFGRTHDNVMGYPFQQALTGWLAGHHPAEKLATMLEEIREHYPLPSFYSSFNLISSHDIPRAITTMAGKPDPGSREDQVTCHLSPEERELGEKYLRLAIFFQVVFPGAVSIYYGDEIGMEGYRDPFNRRTYPEDQDFGAGLRAWFEKTASLRSQWPVLRTGFFKFMKASGHVVVLSRWLEHGKDVFGKSQTGPSDILAAVNRSPKKQFVQLPDKDLTLPAHSVLIEVDGKPFKL